MKEKDEKIKHGDTPAAFGAGLGSLSADYSQDVKNARNERENEIKKSYAYDFVNSAKDSLFKDPKNIEFIKAAKDANDRKARINKIVDEAFLSSEQYKGMQSDIDYYRMPDEEKQKVVDENMRTQLRSRVDESDTYIGNMMNEAYQIESQKNREEQKKLPLLARIGENRTNTAPFQNTPETGNYAAAKSYIDNTKNLIREYEKKDESKLKGAARGFRDAAFDIDSWTFGISEADKQGRIAQAAEKFEKGEELSDSEQSLLDALSVNLAASQYYQGGNRGYTAGEIAGHSLPFMIEMALNPISGSGKGIAKSIAKYGIQKFGAQGAGKTAIKAGARAAGDVVGAFGMTATTGAVRTGADALERMQGEAKFDVDDYGKVSFTGYEEGEGIVPSVLKAIGASTIEYQSEMLGASGIGKLVPKKAKEFGKFFGRMNNSDIVKNLKGLEKRAQWSGVLGEYGEEAYNTAMNSLVIGDQELSDLTNLDKQVDTFMGLALMGGAMSGVNTVGYATDRVRTGSKLRQADQAASNYLEGWDKIKLELNEMGVEERSNVIKEVLKRNDISIPAKNAFSNYVSALTYKDSLTSSAEEIREQNRQKAQANGDKLYDRIRDKRSVALQSLSTEKRTLEAELGDLTSLSIEEIENSPETTPEILDTARRYDVVKNEYQTIQNRLQQEVDEFIEPQLKSIDDVTREDGSIIEINLGDEKISPDIWYVMNGNVSLNGETGRPDESSDKILYAVDGKGRKRQIATSRIQYMKIDNAEEQKQAAKDIAYQQFVAPLEDKENGVRHFEQGEQVEFYNDKGETVAGTVATKQGDTVTIISNDGKKNYTYEESDLNNRMSLPSLGEYRVRDQFDIMLDGDVYPAEITDISDGQLTLYVPGAPDAAQRFMDVGLDQLNSLRGPLNNDNTSENKAENESVPGGEQDNLQPPSENQEQNDIAAENDGPVSETPTFIDQVPKNEKGEMLFEQAEQETTIGALREVYEDADELDSVVDATISNIQKQIGKAKTPKPTGDISKDIANKQAAKQQVVDLNKKLEYWNGIKEGITPKPTTYEERIVSIEQGNAKKRDSNMGEYLSLRDFLLRKISTGQFKFRWNSGDGHKGLVDEILSSKNTEAERRKRISFLNNKGYTPVSLAEEIAENAGQGSEINPGWFNDVQDIRNEINDILLSHDTPTSMIDAATDLRRQPESGEEYEDFIDPELISQYEIEPDEVAKEFSLPFEEMSDNELSSYFDEQEESTNFEEKTDEQRTGIESDRTDVAESEQSAITGGEKGDSAINEVERENNSDLPEETGITAEQSSPTSPEQSVEESAGDDLDRPSEQEEGSLNVRIVDYSDKAIAVYGDTKEIKDQLKVLGGRFNPKLKDGAGWIFPKSREAAVSAVINASVGSPRDKEMQAAADGTGVVESTTAGATAEIEQEAAKVDQNPTEAQKEAGNYQKGHVSVQGFVENQPEYGSSNTVISQDRYEELRKQMKGLLNNLNVGFNPEILSVGAQLAMYHIEAGARKFKDFANKMISDFGDEIRPYLKSFYEGARFMPGMEEHGKEMDSASDVRKYNVSGEIKETKKPSEKKADNKQLSIFEENTESNVRVLQTNSKRLPQREQTSVLQGTGGSERTGGSGDVQGAEIPQTNGGQREPEDGQGSVLPGDADVLKPALVEFEVESNDTEKFNKKKKYADNISAIETVISILKEKRKATPEEKSILSKYVGFGGLKEILLDPSNDSAWKKGETGYRESVSRIIELAKEFDEVTGVDDTLQKIRGSIINAHFTPQTVINAIYKGLKQLGFKGGNILEPSAGIGNFISYMPESVKKKSNISAVELDNLTGNILKALHDNAHVQISGIENASIAPGSQDLVISNVPFGNYKVYDRAFKGDREQFLNRIHNYFFAKALDQVRDGGLVAFVTSKGVLDSPGNSNIREYLNKNAEFLGAVRLPNTTFNNTANTEVVTDVIFLRKTKNATNPDFVNVSNMEATHKDGETENMTVNQYFIDNPQNMLGDIEAGGLYSREDYTLKDNGTFKNLDKVIKGMLPSNIYSGVSSAMGLQANDLSQQFEHVKEGNIAYSDGELYRKEDDIATPFKINEPESKIKDYISLRDALMELIYSEYAGYKPEVISENRQKLNDLYDNFVKNYGKIGQSILKIAKVDADGYNVLSLDNNGEKADIFSKRTINPISVKTHADTLDEAIVISLSETAGVDIERIAQLLGKSVEEIKEESKGKLFERPEGGFVTRDEYLSGNVKQKLKEAKQAVEGGFTEFQFNVDELERVIPADIPAVQIEARLGSRWIPASVYSQFAKEILNDDSLSISYSSGVDQYFINGKSSTVEATKTYGTSRVNGAEIILSALHINPPKVYDYYKEFGQQKRELNKEETDLAVQKYQEVRDLFEDWVYKAPDRRELLSGIYNEKFNTSVRRKYNGEHLTVPGINDVSLRDHQKDAIWMLLQNGGGVIDHLVGAGKTYVMVAGTMEMKRTGVAKKPMIMALKSTIPQIVETYRAAYPMAKILAPMEKDFEKENRLKLFSKIANNEWDVIIMSHENYGKIPHERDIQERLINQELEELEKERYEFEMNNDRAALKGLEIRIKNLNARLDKLADIDKDNSLTFEQMGIDHLMIDESQQFKNLSYITKQRSVAGLGNAEGSKRAFNLLTGIRYLQERLGGDKGATFLSGTPITNSIVEMYSLLNYLRPSKMAELGFTSFDAWATTFANPTTDIEFTVTGNFKQKTRFREFMNVPELSMLYTEIADIRTDDNLKLDKPSMKGKGYSVVDIQMSDDQKEFSERLMKFAETKDGKLIGRGELSDNEKSAAMLLATNLSSKMAIDMRLVDSSYGYDPNGKIAKLVENVTKTYNETSDHKGTQLIFSDLGTPKNASNKSALLRDYLEDELGLNIDALNEIFGDTSVVNYRYPAITTARKKMIDILEIPEEQVDQIIKDSENSVGSFDVYNEVKKRLIENGIPEEQVVFIHDYNTSKKKEALFNKVNEGQIRIILGSTQKLGTGVNVQERIVAVHHIDVPWTPASMEQRNGRALRQGNRVAKQFLNNELPVYAYATERTLDAYKYQLLQTKQTFLNQVKSGEVTERVIKEGEGDAESGVGYAELVAMLSGNQDILKKSKLEEKLARLKRAKRNFDGEFYEAQSQIKRLEEHIPLIEENIKKSEENVKLAKGFKFVENKLVIDSFNGKQSTKKEKDKVVPYDRTDYAKEAIEHIERKINRMDFEDHDKINLGGYEIEFYPIHSGNKGMFSSDKKPGVSLNMNGVNYAVNFSTIPGILLNNIQKAITDQIPNVLQSQRNTLEQNKRNLTSYKEIVERGNVWPKQEEYDQIVNELKEVTERIDKDINKKDDVLFRLYGNESESELEGKTKEEKRDIVSEYVKVLESNFKSFAPVVVLEDKPALIKYLRDNGANEKNVVVAEKSDAPMCGVLFHGNILINSDAMGSLQEVQKVWVHETFHVWSKQFPENALSLNLDDKVLNSYLPKDYHKLTKQEKNEEILAYAAESASVGFKITKRDIKDQVKPIVYKFLDYITDGKFSKNNTDLWGGRGRNESPLQDNERGGNTGIGTSGQGNSTGQPQNKNEDIRAGDGGISSLKEIDDYNGFISKVFSGLKDKSEVYSKARANGMDLHGAVEEYLSEIDNPEELNRIRELLGINLPGNALQYLLWKNANPNNGSPEWKAKEALKARELDSNILFRKGEPPSKFSTNEYEQRVRSRYNRGFRSLMFGIEEGWFDRMNSLRILQEAIGGKNIHDKANAYLLENQLSSRSEADVRDYMKNFIDPMYEAAVDIFGKDLELIDNYLIAKHGLERNEYMARQEADRWMEKEIKKLNLPLDEAPTPDQMEAIDKIKADAEYKYEKLSDKDYSGLTALAEERDLKEKPKEAAEKIVKELEDAIPVEKINRLWETINNATKWMLDKQYESGMMTKEAYNKIRDMYKFYVPLRGFDETTATDLYDYILNEPSDFNSVLKNAKGRTSKSESPFASIMNMAESGILQSNRNKMKQAFYRLVATNPSNFASIQDVWLVKHGNDWIEEFPKIPENATPDQVIEAIVDFNNEMEELATSGDAARGKNKLDFGVKINKAQASEHVVRVWIGGEEKVIFINGNPRAAQAINGLTNDNAKERKEIVEKTRYWMRQMSANFTSRNPAFMVTNFMRDIQFALVSAAIKEGGRYSAQLAINAVKVPKTIALNIWGNGGGGYDNYWKEFISNGGETGYSHLHTMDYHRKYVDKRLRELTDQRDLLKPFRIYVEHIGNANRLIEDISRFSTFVTSRQAGRSIERSVADAKDITINFNRKGSGGFGAELIHTLFLFANPALQSLRQMGMLAKKNPKGFTAALAISMTMGAMIPLLNDFLINMFGDDDDKDAYWNLPEWTRRNHLVLYTPWLGKKRFVTLALPHELRGFYGIGEMAYNAGVGRLRHENIPLQTTKQLANMLPIDPTGGKTSLIPDVFRPMAEAFWFNRNFMDRPIYKDTPWNKFDPEWKKAYKGTSQWLVEGAKWLNEVSGGDDVVKGKINWNPAQLQHVFGGYTGGAWTTYRDLVNVAYDLISGEGVTVNQVPVANKIIRKSDERGKEGRINNEYFFYLDWMKDYEHKKNGYKELLTDKEYEDKYRDLLGGDETAMYQYAKVMTKIINNLMDKDKEESNKKKEEFVNRMWELEKNK